MGRILLYYKYVSIADTKQMREWQRKLCSKLGLKGRILIGQEGINGTVGGTIEATKQYIQEMKQHPLFSDIDFKESEGDADHFPRLRVAVRKEIVTLGIDPHEITPKDTGKHLSPDEVHELIEKKKNKDLVILDARNNYESAIGTFEGAVTPDIENFRDFPEYIDKNADTFKNKEVLMFCTGGIRCERATALLKKKNIAKEVYQIKGGIHRYAEKYPDGYFRGKNYVFDGRIAVKINDDVLGTCYICKIQCDEYTNCVNVQCNLQFIACKSCFKEFKNTCSKDCLEKVKNQKVAIRTKTAKIDAQHAKKSNSRS